MEEMKEMKEKSKLIFKPVIQADYDYINSFLKLQEYRICDYTYGVLYMWSGFLNYTYAVYEGMLIISSNSNGNITFSIPLGNGDVDKALGQIELYCQEKKLPLKFHGVTQKAIDIIEKRFPDKLEIIEMVNWGEYLYNVDDLLDLRGKKYHSKRNHISQFKRLFPSYEFKVINAENMPLIKEFLEVYYNNTEKKHELFEIEKEMLCNIIKDYNKLQLLGGYIEVDGKVAAFSIGEILRDVIYIHIEKADINYKGSYAVINNEFLKAFHNNNIKYVNREEDAGDLGLRKAKQSYYPIEIIKKYSVKEKKH